MKKIFVLGGIVIIGILIVAFFINKDGDANENLGEANIKLPSDVIGTKTGTTTAGVYFASRATSTYRIKSGSADQLMLTMLAIKASTTPGSWVNLSLLGSNDWDCMTATSTLNANDTTNQQVLTSEVNWYDIGQHVVELAGTQTIPSATSTLTWTSTAGHSQDITLTNLNYQCVKVEISSSSTEVFMQARNK